MVSVCGVWKCRLPESRHFGSGWLYVAGQNHLSRCWPGTTLSCFLLWRVFVQTPGLSSILPLTRFWLRVSFPLLCVLQPPRLPHGYGTKRLILEAFQVLEALVVCGQLGGSRPPCTDFYVGIAVMSRLPESLPIWKISSLFTLVSFLFNTPLPNAWYRCSAVLRTCPRLLLSKVCANSTSPVNSSHLSSPCEPRVPGSGLVLRASLRAGIDYKLQFSRPFHLYVTFEDRDLP